MLLSTIKTVLDKRIELEVSYLKFKLKKKKTFFIKLMHNLYRCKWMLFLLISQIILENLPAFFFQKCKIINRHFLNNNEITLKTNLILKCPLD